METPAIYETKKTPQVELMELKLTVKLFCNQMEAIQMIARNEFLQIQMNSTYYKQMKELSK